jgi:hypothetical protein
MLQDQEPEPSDNDIVLTRPVKVTVHIRNMVEVIDPNRLTGKLARWPIPFPHHDLLS